MKTILRVILIEVLFNAISIVCIYYLWNWLMPDLIMAKEITFFQAWGMRTLVQFCVWFRSSDKK
jgi:hypothetical protein